MSTTSQFYSDRADECARDADRATLDNVRDRFLRAEAAWRAMAARIERSERIRDQREVDRIATAPAATPALATAPTSAPAEPVL